MFLNACNILRGRTLEMCIRDRHYRLARQLALRGWKTVIFAASTVHQSDINLVEGDAPYVVRDVDGVTFVHVRARPYKGNGRRRILNILDYVKGCRRVAPLFLSLIHI